MGTPFMGEVKIISWNFAPQGWAFCNAQLLPINQNQALFSLFGTTYGGDGRTTFGLPDLRGRVALDDGNGFTLGQTGGATAHTLTANEMAAHQHLVQASTQPATLPLPTNNLPAQTTASLYGNGSNNANAILHPSSVSSVGGSQPHTNMQPYLVVNFIVALQGVFPSQN